MAYHEKTLVRYKGVEGEFIKVTLSFREITSPSQALHPDKPHVFIQMDDGSCRQEQLVVGANNQELNLYVADEPYFQRPISRQYCRDHIAETVAEQSKMWRENDLTVDEVCFELTNLEDKLDGIVD